MRTHICFYSLQLLLTILLFSSSALALSQSKTTVYKSDVMGRLSFIEDSVNSIRDYNYDAAGNSTDVILGVAVDDPIVSPPAKPTGLSIAQISFAPAPGIYKMSWDAVSGATYYMIKVFTSGISDIKVSASSSPVSAYHQGRVISIRACNPSACSEPAYF